MGLPLPTILAQVAALTLGDRTELRARVESADQIVEAETRPLAALELSGRRASLLMSYQPSFILSPLKIDDDALTILHLANAQLTYRLVWPRTTIEFRESAEYQRRNFSLQALSAPFGNPGLAPVPPAAEPDPAAPPADSGGTAGQAAEDPQRFRTGRGNLDTGTVRSTITLQHRISNRTTFGSSVSAHATEGLDEQSRLVYPRLYGADALAEVRHASTRTNTWISRATGQGVITENTGKTAIGTAEEGLLHRFSRTTNGLLMGGAAYAYSDVGEAPTHYIYPVAFASIDYATHAQRGRFDFNASVSYSPAIDQTTGALDSRVVSQVGAQWSRSHQTYYLRLTGTVSLEPNSPGALNSFLAVGGQSYQVTERFSFYSYVDCTFSGRPNENQDLDYVGVGAGTLYDLRGGFAFETGLRAAFNRFAGTEVVPLTGGAFVALTWGTVIR